MRATRRLLSDAVEDYQGAFRPVPGSGRLSECGAPEPLVMVMHPIEANEQLSAARMACPACGHMLPPWGFARRRSVRGHDGTIELRPRRARCRGCRTTHVMLPASCLPRRAVTVQIVGQALLAAVNGASHRTIAADLELPADTVRGWIRRATAHASWHREWGTIMAALRR
jgi:hypothetical protein